MKKGPAQRARHRASAVDGTVGEETEHPTSGEDSVSRGVAPEAALQVASTQLAPRGESTLYGSRQFYADCVTQLVASTKFGVELSGAVLARRVENRTLLVGLVRKETGESRRVAIDGTWGEILWHTHPGMRGSLSSFSEQDIAVAKQTKKPLLVVGFGVLSPDFLTTMALPIGFKRGPAGIAIAAGLKGILALEKNGKFSERALTYGVQARVCYPSGKIAPVMRSHATPMQAALEDVGYFLDRTAGTIERVGQGAIKKAMQKAVDWFK